MLLFMKLSLLIPCKMQREMTRERERAREKERDREMEMERERERERSRGVKIKNIKKQNLLYGCFKNNPHKR